MENKNEKIIKPKAMAMLTIPLAVASPLAPPVSAQAAPQRQAPAPDKTSQDEQIPMREEITAAIPSFAFSGVSSYRVSSGDSIASIAKRFGITISRLTALNKLEPENPIRVGQVLRLTGEPVESEQPQSYKVKSGDTLQKIARQHGLSLDELLALNRIESSTIVYPGQRLQVARIIPARGSSSKSETSYQVGPGDTLQSIADKFSVSVESLRTFNGLSRSSIIYVGQTLALRPQRANSVSQQSATAPPILSAQPQDTSKTCELHGVHLVKAGETIAKIAAVYGLSPQSLLTENSLSWSSTIYVGQRLILPGVHSAAECESLVPLSQSMFESANILREVGTQIGVGDYGIVIALTAAMAESGLLHHASNGNRFGLFQMSARSGWGSISQLLDPKYSARAFFEGVTSPSGIVRKGLVSLEGWSRSPASHAAHWVLKHQAVENYQRWELSAHAWLTELKSSPLNV